MAKDLKKMAAEARAHAARLLAKAEAIERNDVRCICDKCRQPIHWSDNYTIVQPMEYAPKWQERQDGMDYNEKYLGQRNYDAICHKCS